MPRRRKKVAVKHEVIPLKGEKEPRSKSSTGMAVDDVGDIYISDYYNSIIYRIDTKTYNTRIFAGSGIGGLEDGPRMTAKFSMPHGITFDKDQNLLVCDSYNNAIRKITPCGMVETWAGGKTRPGLVDGDGHVDVARLSRPQFIVFNKNTLMTFFTENSSFRVRRISSQGMVETIFADKCPPYGLAMDPFGNILTYVYNNIRVIYTSNEKNGCGKDLFVDNLTYVYTGLEAQFDGFHDLVVDETGRIFVLWDHDYKRSNYISKVARIDYESKILLSTSSITFPRELISLIISFLPYVVTIETLSIAERDPYLTTLCAFGKNLLAIGSDPKQLLRLAV